MGDGSHRMSVRFWGVRGSLPAPLTGQQVEDKIVAAVSRLRAVPENLCVSEHELRRLVRELPFPMRSTYGGNTTCVEVRCNGVPFVLDMGTGLRELGLEWARPATYPIDGVVLQSHLHWDHIHGFPFWRQFYAPRRKVEARMQLCGGTKGGASLKSALHRQMSAPEFPVSFKTERHTGMRLGFRPLFDGWEAAFGDVSSPIHVLARKLHHPQDCYGFRIEACGVVLAFTTDHEPHCTNDVPYGLRELVQDADLWITDCQYSQDEYQRKLGWGHSFPDYIANVAVTTGVRRIVTTHHDPESSDERIERLADEVRQLSLVPTIPAYEGLALFVGSLAT